ncbi:hypothetical protein [Roseateles sp. YR242]|uniref:hypothetical protein n=1 Tax=Roseateles sp. YR242 TaxID=1855305 RepID=UPI00116089A9|nr:hypothetical protein [Roseateles sp. YR242]
MKQIPSQRAELQELLNKKVDWILALQTKLLTDLAKLPRREEELAPVRQLLRMHRDATDATCHMLANLPAHQHILILRRWSEEMTSAARTLEKLPPSSGTAECKTLLDELQGKFHRISASEDLELLLQLLLLCHERIALEQRPPAEWRSHRALSQLPSVPLPRLTPSAQPPLLAALVKRGTSESAPTADQPLSLPLPLPLPISHGRSESTSKEETLASVHEYMKLLDRAQASTTASSATVTPTSTDPDIAEAPARVTRKTGRTRPSNAPSACEGPTTTAKRGRRAASTSSAPVATVGWKSTGSSPAHGSSNDLDPLMEAADMGSFGLIDFINDSAMPDTSLQPSPTATSLATPKNETS